MSIEPLTDLTAGMAILAGGVGLYLSSTWDLPSSGEVTVVILGVCVAAGAAAGWLRRRGRRTPGTAGGSPTATAE